MADNVFLDKLKQHSLGGGENWNRIMKILADFCTAIEDYSSKTLVCEPLPGYETNLGQEYRITVVPKGREASEPAATVLLRAHVKPVGFPMYLDLYEDDVKEIRDEPGLNQALLDFLGKDSTRSVIVSLSRLAKKTA